MDDTLISAVFALGVVKVRNESEIDQLLKATSLKMDDDGAHLHCAGHPLRWPSIGGNPNCVI